VPAHRGCFHMKISDCRPLARADLSLTAFALGCSQMGGLYHATSSQDAGEVFAQAWRAGIRYFDTAPFYGYTRSEHRLGALLAEVDRSECVVSTKVGRLMQADASVAPGDGGWSNPFPFRPRYDYSYGGIMRSFEDSQQRMGLANFDILYVHDIGRLTHGEQHDHHWKQLTGGGFKALEELRASGMTRAIGLGVNEWQVVMDAMQEIDLDCTMLAGRYTLLGQSCLHTLMDASWRRGNAIVIAGPFNSGILAGSTKYDYADAPDDIVQRVKALQDTCAEFDVPLPAAALQFPMAHPAVVSCVAGVSHADQLRQNVRWFEQEIPDELWDALRDRNLIDASAPCPSSHTHRPAV
jgi:D-threo-aldose 1-dehydrogenase